MKKKTRQSAENKADKPQKSNGGGLFYCMGSNRILLIAPHGHDEPGTAEIAKDVQGFFKCSAILNKKVPKAERNYNRINQAKSDKQYVEAIRDFAKTDEYTLVVFVHGIGDGNINTEAKRLGIAEGKLEAVIGYGQPDNLCARKETAQALVKALTDNGICAAEAFKVADGYCAAHPNIMAQWFNKNELDDFTKVEVIQIEFKGSGVRNADSLTQTAINLARALSEVTGLPLPENIEKNAPQKNLPVPVDSSPNLPKAEAADAIQEEKEADAVLVDAAFNHLRDIVGKAARDMMKREQAAAVEAGEYLIKNFYGDNYDLAANGKMTRRASFRALEKRFKSCAGGGPKKSWLHNAVKITVDERRFAKIDDTDAVHAYGQLGLTQKVLLLPLPQEDKVQLAKEIAEKNMTVAETREHIKAFKAANGVKPKSTVAEKATGDKADDERSRLKQSAKELADSVAAHHRIITKQVAEIEKIEGTLNKLPKAGKRLCRMDRA